MNLLLVIGLICHLRLRLNDSKVTLKQGGVVDGETEAVSGFSEGDVVTAGGSWPEFRFLFV